MFYPGVRRVNTTPWTPRRKPSPSRVLSLEARDDDRRPRRSVPPVLEPRPNGLADRFSQRFGPENPVRVFIVALLAGYALLVTAMVFLGLLLIHVLLPIGGLQEADEDFSQWLADNRSPTQEDISWVGSTLSGGHVIPGGPRDRPRDLPDHAALDPRGFRRSRRRRRVCDLSRHVVDRRARAARRRAAREPSGRRELPVRTHGRRRRHVRRASPLAGIEVRQRRRPCRRGRSRRRHPAVRRPGRGCTAACTTSPTSSPVCSWVSAPCVILVFAARAARASTDRRDGVGIAADAGTS